MRGELSVGVGSVIHPTTPKVGHQSAGYFSPPDVCIGCSSHCTVDVPIWPHRNQVFIVTLACNVNVDVKCTHTTALWWKIWNRKLWKRGSFATAPCSFASNGATLGFWVSNIDPSDISAYPVTQGKLSGLESHKYDDDEDQPWSPCGKYLSYELLRWSISRILPLSLSLSMAWIFHHDRNCKKGEFLENLKDRKTNIQELFCEMTDCH